MRLDQLEVGMKIRICKDPTISIRKFSGGIAKREMAGKTTTVYIILPEKNAILVRDNRKRKWTIHIDDIRSIKSLPPIKPQIFDPNQLMR